MPQYEGKEVLTIGKAEACKRVAEQWFDAKGYGDAPAMYKPGHEGAMWVLSLEGYGEWATDISADPDVKWPEGVFAEPVADWCLGLYPATDPTVISEGQALAKQWETAVAQGNEWAQQKVGAAMAKFLNEKH